MNGSEYIIKAAGESGIDVCFANPGTTELPLVVALDTVGGIRPVLGLFEGVCTGAADGYARMLQKPAMVLLHLDPAWQTVWRICIMPKGRTVKIVTVVGEHSTWHRPFDPPLAMDIESLAKTVSEWQRTCVACDWLGQDMADAVEAADKGQIATLIVPFDLQTEKCGSGAVVSHKKEKPSVSMGAVKTAATLLRRQKNSPDARQ